MVKYFKYKDKTYKAILWQTKKNAEFTVVEHPDFLWTKYSIESKSIYREILRPQTSRNIDSMIERWKQMQERNGI